MELEVYLETNTTSSMALDLDFTVPYNQTFSYTKDLDLFLVNIASVLSFGPKISFGVGASVEASAGVDVLLDIESTINNGTVTLDCKYSFLPKTIRGAYLTKSRYGKSYSCRELEPFGLRRCDHLRGS